MDRLVCLRNRGTWLVQLPLHTSTRLNNLSTISVVDLGGYVFLGEESSFAECLDNIYTSPFLVPDGFNDSIPI